LKVSNISMPLVARADAERPSRHAAFVRADALRGSFCAVVRALGGNPSRFLAAEGINKDVLEDSSGVLMFRSMIDLLEHASHELDCPDFGLRLARQCSDGISVLGPLEVAMRNSSTVRAAFNYCAKYMHVYSPAIHFGVLRDEHGRGEFMYWDILLDDVPYQRQVSEHALGLACNAVKALSDGEVRPREIWFAHAAKAPMNSYREYFGAPVRFDMPYNALYFRESELDRPIANRHAQIYEMATTYIDLTYPLSSVLLTSQVRVILARLLATNRCTQTVIAAMLAMHPRTFQRRLREEGTTFEEIVDTVRREIALRSLSDGSVSLVRIAEKLGYSETSVLTRSCQRWFNLSPREMRKAVAAGLPVQSCTR
jgi:AraC-like DNA-binding protein